MLVKDTKSVRYLIALFRNRISIASIQKWKLKANFQNVFVMFILVPAIADPGGRAV